MEESIDDAKFDRASFWIQIHNLPINRMNKANVKAIGQSLGNVEQVDTPPNGECRGRYIRVWANIDINQPLCRSRFINMGDLDPLWISFQYERIDRKSVV